MKITGKVALKRLVNKYDRTKTFDDVEIYDIWLDESLDPNWPGNWWGKCDLEGKQWEVVASQGHKEVDGIIKENERRTWRNKRRLSHRKITLQIDDYDITRYLEQQGIVSSTIEIERLRDEIIKKANGIIRYNYPGLYEFSEGDVE